MIIKETCYCQSTFSIEIELEQMVHAVSAVAVWRAEHRHNQRAEPTDLTDRQRAIADLVQRGHYNEEIANELHTSVGTIKAEVSKIMKKLGVGKRSEIHVPGVAE